jgi:hypothetical protein
LKNQKVVLLVLMVVGIGMMISCTKTGSAGTNGTNGATGAAGATGATGATGPDSVQYSSIVTLTSMGRAYSNWYGDSVEVDTLSASGITSSILTKGAVVGYVYLPTYLTTGDSSFVNIDNVNFVNSLTQLPIVGKLVVYWDKNWTDYTNYKFRFVVIPANVAVTDISGNSKNYTAMQLKNLDYSTLTSILKVAQTPKTVKTGSAY